MNLGPWDGRRRRNHGAMAATRGINDCLQRCLCSVVFYSQALPRYYHDYVVKGLYSPMSFECAKIE